MDDAAIAQQRFGLGPRADEAPPGSPRAWLSAQIEGYRPELPGIERIASRAEIVADLAAYRDRIKAARTAAPTPPAASVVPAPPAMTTRAPGAPGAPASTSGKPGALPPAAKPIKAEERQFARDQHITQVGLRVRAAVASPTPFAERLVHFWANHFAVSADKLQTIAFAGRLEFDAIRPHIFCRFEDMLLAVARHPAMLLYLDQAQSLGPDSPIGQRANRGGRKAGLNENLAREILELHTLGVRSGYSQADVTEFARALTGWTVTGFARGPLARLMGDAAPPGGEFVFVPQMHEGGARTILGQRFADAGEGQARSVLAMLARHPATAQHLATKLARHFVADAPPPALIARLKAAYLGSNGSLRAMSEALIAAPEAWHPAPQKFRTPWLWSLAALRALSGDGRDPLAKVPDPRLTALFVELGQPVWRPGSPAGWDDIAASWAAPDALYRRAELAGTLARGGGAGVDPRALARALFGTGISPHSAEAIARADSPGQGLALLLMLPEMLRV